MRYDVEVSGFPSSHAGHLCLLRLKEDDYPGTTRIEEWPSWDLPVLKWGKSQGGVVGFSHSGWGLKTSTDEIPTDEIPPFDGIGANEYIVDVVHDAVDFISTVDTPAPWELNIWYHTLNCGFRTRISGETDFPCIYGERVGLGRVYVKLEDGRLDFNRWCQGVKEGRSYVSDGRSHLLDFKVNDRALGESGSELKLSSPASVRVTARVAAYLDAEPTAQAKAIHDRPLEREAILGHRASADRQVAQGACGADRQRPTRRSARDRGERSDRRHFLRRPGQEVDAGSLCASCPLHTPTRSSCSWTTSRSAHRKNRPSGV